MSRIKVSQLSIYPVKSAAGIDVPAVLLDRLGPQYDRRWMVVDSEGIFVSQRQHSRLCLVTVQVDNERLKLQAPGYNRLCISHFSAIDSVEVKVWNDHVMAYDCGDEAAIWLSEFLQISCRLVYMPENNHRKVDQNYAKTDSRVSFADGFPLLMISEESLLAFNTCLDNPIEMNRFRPNLVVRGAQPFEEDNWKQIRIGRMVFTLAKPCSRCVIPSIDPTTAKQEPSVAKALAIHRRREGSVFFGQNLIFDGAGWLKLGDRVEILC